MDGRGREELGCTPNSVNEITWVLSSKGVRARTKTFVTKPTKKNGCVFVCMEERAGELETRTELISQT